MDPHSVLGVGPGATEAEIVRAFRRLAILHHPDRNDGSSAAASRFREIESAYDALRARFGAHLGATERAHGEGDGRHARTLDREPVGRVYARVERLNEAVRRALAAPDGETMAAVIDAARWTRLDVDNALALKGHVAELRDAHWSRLRFTTPEGALATLQAFLDVPPRTLDLVEMRNLRARLDGLLAVARGYPSRPEG